MSLTPDFELHYLENRRRAEESARRAAPALALAPLPNFRCVHVAKKILGAIKHQTSKEA